MVATKLFNKDEILFITILKMLFNYAKAFEI